ncbi:hypothetical protein KXD40_000315 [Peronospora effusa]|uniref:FYVE-type domain-containing protein n=1 Tax=Peronospora effusa TaxID=542832 RepID=A0A3M6VCR7_9STRA|nr:hypothetical protein DD238_004349 [Peronospora effusa]UIZ21005.1 hypothetical protein KXD40_000315 [Peronospora effusa]
MSLDVKPLGFLIFQLSDSISRTTSSMFAPLSISLSQALKLEIMMKQQVQDAVLARTAQLALDNKLDSNWRFVGSLGQLKTFKHRGADSCSSSSSWATTLERTSDDNDPVNSSQTWTRSQSISYIRQRRVSFSRRTVSASTTCRDPLNLHRPVQSFRTFGRIQGNYRDIVGVHYATNSVDFVRQQKLLSPIAIDGAVLHTIRATKDSYLGIKWLAEQSVAGKRDVCFVEMVGYTIDTNGQEIGFVALASVDVPECPELARPPMKLTRVRMKRTMLVIPTAGALKSTSDVFVMSASEANESSIAALAQCRLNMAILNDLSLVIDSQNIARQKLALQKNWVPDEKRASCSICSRRFRFMLRRRHHCRLCGDIVCKTCYVYRAVSDADMEDGYNCKSANTTVICQTKFCVRCVMGLRVMDKRSDHFTQQIPKAMSLEKDTLDMSCSSLEWQSTSNVRDSAVTYFKRGTNEKHTLDLDQLYTMSALQKISPHMDANDEIGGTNTQAVVPRGLISYGSGGPKCLRPSLSVNPVHSNSYSKLCELSRHRSTASLGSKSASFTRRRHQQ